jgi:GNAT superfamily N-acetyltransferase
MNNLLSYNKWILEYSIVESLRVDLTGAFKYAGWEVNTTDLRSRPTYELYKNGEYVAFIILGSVNYSDMNGKFPGKYLAIEAISVQEDWRGKGIYTSILKTIVQNYPRIRGIVSWKYSDNDQERSEDANKFWKSMVKKDRKAHLIKWDPWDSGEIEDTYILLK